MKDSSQNPQLCHNKLIFSVPVFDTYLHGVVFQSVSHPGSETDKCTNMYPPIARKMKFKIEERENYVIEIHELG